MRNYFFNRNRIYTSKIRVSPLEKNGRAHVAIATDCLC